MTISIRPATINDIPLLSQLAPDIYREHFSHLWYSAEEMEAYLVSEYSESILTKSLKDPAVGWFVAYNNAPIGFAKLTRDSVIPDTNLSGVLLNKLYLNAAVTGKKYGKVMFEYLVREAKKQKQTFFWLEVLEQNPRARKFYEQQGMTFIKDTLFKTESQQSTIHVMGMNI
ncbi:GNAT family N-acetyltransferase [Klebsiella sp. BIGb0407]|uniref:GNAT family N-acetyltransferase n=1 Tax=Klebsiella sp. BIGb0407 TaxID=2940603 RepID=UPI00216A241A|nr:GNAT family N-acetyltransferase [Klebsiella sp. BIGb0407]MCS3431353.1 ribosomal protein S18 acetylase RimI-like enzyme [Klebsiella sp. BIGb0407]